MGFLRTKYPTDKDLTSATSKFVKFTDPGQVYVGMVAGFDEGKYGTEVFFADGKRVTLNSKVLLREVTNCDPDIGDQLRITYIGNEPQTEDQKNAQLNPTKLYKVEIAKAPPTTFASPANDPAKVPETLQTEATEDQPF